MIKMQTYGMLDVSDGLKDLEKELLGLGAKDGQRTLTSAARKAFQPVLEAARANAPVDTGMLRDHIIIRAQKPKQGDNVVTVGLWVKKAKTGRPDSKRPLSHQSPHWRWHFVEGGTSTQPARPFLRPALDANAETVVAGLNGELRKAIDRVLRKRKRDGVRGATKRAMAEAKAFSKAGWKGLKRGLR